MRKKKPSIDLILESIDLRLMVKKEEESFQNRSLSPRAYHGRLDLYHLATLHQPYYNQINRRY